MRQELAMLLLAVVTTPGRVHCEEPQLDMSLIRSFASAASPGSGWQCWPTRAQEPEQRRSSSGGSGPRVVMKVTRSVSRAQALLRLYLELERGGKEASTIPECHHGGGHCHRGSLHKDDVNLIPNGEPAVAVAF